MRLAPSTRFEIVRRFLAAITDNLIFDHLTLVERTQAGTLDSGDMDEHVSAAVLGLNESIALGRVEPFDDASSHHRLLECTNVIAAARPLIRSQRCLWEGTRKVRDKQGQDRISAVYAVPARASTARGDRE